MTDTEEILRRVEHEVTSTGRVGEPTCRHLARLAPEVRATFDQALRFLGCPAPSTPSAPTSASPGDRVRASRLMLLCFFRETGEPAWSSWALERVLQAVTDTPGGAVSDLLSALYLILGERGIVLSETVKNLIRDVVVLSVSRSRGAYETGGFPELLRMTTENLTAAQAYLAFLAIPPTMIEHACAAAILRALEGTPYISEVRETFEQEPGELDRHPDGTSDGRLAQLDLVPSPRDNDSPLSIDPALDHLRAPRD